MIRDLIIFGGQSNMQGQTERLSSDKPIDGALEYRLLEDRLLPLADPCGEDIGADLSRGYPYSDSVYATWHGDNVLGSACYGNTTLLPSFCASYRGAALGQPEVIAVHAAKGSTGIDYWLPDTDGYKALVAKSRAAAAAGQSVRRRLMVWLQGESDAIIGMKREEYAEKLSSFGHALERDLGLDRFGIIRVGRFTRDERDFEIMAAQDELCERDELFVMLTRIASELCTDERYAEYMNPNVGGHYSASGLELLGRLGGEALAAQADAMAPGL